jgi:hypothetical protein
MMETGKEKKKYIIEVVMRNAFATRPETECLPLWGSD